MRLQTQLGLAFAVVTLAPIAALTFGARVMMKRQFKAEFKRQMDEAVDQIGAERRRVGADVEQALGHMATPDNQLLHPLLVKLAHGPLADDVQQTLMDDVGEQMRALGFDVLTLLDERGTVLASGSFPGRAGDVDAEALQRARSGGTIAHLVDEQVVVKGRKRVALALEAARAVEIAGVPHARVFVIGGRVLGAEFLQPLNAANAELRAADDTLLASKNTHPLVDKQALRIAVPLTRADATIAANVIYWESDAELRDQLERLTVGAIAAAIVGLLFANAVGWLLARRISGRLGRLADGARAVSRGELDTQVPVRGRDELAELGAAFNTMTRDVRAAREDLARAERVAAWREIAQRIAHEIKNPLTPIQMAIETLQRAQAKGPQVFDALFAESARAILDEVARLKHIVAEFSAFARMPQPELKPCAVGEVVEAALKLYDGAVPVERELDPSLPPALADRDQLTQVLLNLVENAREAVTSHPAGGRIRVRTRAADGRVELEVADDGPGISDEARAKLFTPYFTTKARGTGLGLAIVHRIVTDHGGEIRVAGSPGAGATFTVSLLRA
ncbi:MAG TPA: ATP-binding protein [Polyangia bacterium]|nr:ATP-binding protein [Polyangia bacterium]